MTTSQVDVTIPTDNVRVSKATMRTQFTTIRNELNVLFSRIGEAGRLAFDAFLTAEEIDRRIRKQLGKTNYARENLAFNWRNL